MAFIKNILKTQAKSDLFSPLAAQLGLDPPKLECQLPLSPKAFTRANMPK